MVKTGDIYQFKTESGESAELKVLAVVKELPAKVRQVLNMVDNCSLVSVRVLNDDQRVLKGVYLDKITRRHKGIFTFIKNVDVSDSELQYPFFLQTFRVNRDLVRNFFTNGFVNFECEDEDILGLLDNDDVRLSFGFPESLPMLMSSMEKIENKKKSSDLRYSKNKQIYKNHFNVPLET